MSAQEGFLTDVRTMGLFFRACRRWHIDHPEDRLTLMRELMRRKKVRYLRDVDAAMRGKKVLRIGFEPKENDK